MNFTRGKVFFDTNIFIYLLTASEPEKRQKCKTVLEKLIANRNLLVWSTQVIQELSSNLIKKQGIKPLRVKSLLSGFQKFELIVSDFSNLEHALEITENNKLSFWDSLIISSAASAKCSYLLSEDMHHGQKIEGLEIINPFLI